MGSNTSHCKVRNSTGSVVNNYSCNTFYSVMMQFFYVLLLSERKILFLSILFGMIWKAKQRQYNHTSIHELSCFWICIWEKYYQAEDNINFSIIGKMNYWSDAFSAFPQSISIFRSSIHFLFLCFILSKISWTMSSSKKKPGVPHCLVHEKSTCLVVYRTASLLFFLSMRMVGCDIHVQTAVASKRIHPPGLNIKTEQGWLEVSEIMKEMMMYLNWSFYERVRDQRWGEIATRKRRPTPKQNKVADCYKCIG